MKLIFTTCIIIQYLVNGIVAQYSNCNVSRVQYGTTLVQVIFQFQCFPPASNDPVFPTGGSNPSEFNQLLLSPNTYTILPNANICNFLKIYLLDISFNRLTSITGLFQTLKCLVSLTTLIMSNNYISSPLLKSDFDDTFSQQLVSIDLSNNKIPSIDSNFFFKSDGTSRFLNLQYLNLAYNSMYQFDMLMPLTVPNNNLSFLLNSNPINNLVNQLNAQYSDTRFAYPGVGNRKISITNNNLLVLDDTNLIQYGLNSQTDLELFLNKISNYDLRQLSNKIVKCSCNGTLISSWYSSLLSSSLINKNSLINQLMCVDINQSVFLKNPNCETSNSSASAGALTETTSSAYYALFVFLIIPILILLLVFCCCLRPINKCLFRKCNTTCFSSCRPGDTAEYSLKKYDATIMCSEYERDWVDAKLLTKLSTRKGFVIHKIGSYHRGFSKDYNEFLRLSKRVVLIFSKNFLKGEWKNENFQNEIKMICAEDPECVVIPINYDLSNKEMNKILSELQDYNSTSCFSINQKLRHSMILKNVEPLTNNSTDFGKNFNFLMPIKEKFNDKETVPTIITESLKNKKEKKEPSIQSISAIKLEHEIDLDDRKPFVNKTNKKKSGKIESSKFEKFNSSLNSSIHFLKSETESDCPSILDYSFNSNRSKPRNFDFNLNTTNNSAIHKPQAKRQIKNLPFIREELSRENDTPVLKHMNSLPRLPDTNLSKDIVFNTIERKHLENLSFEHPNGNKNVEETDNTSIEFYLRKSRKELRPHSLHQHNHRDSHSESLRPSLDSIANRLDYSADSPRKRKKKSKQIDGNIKTAKNKKERLQILENMLSSQ